MVVTLNLSMESGVQEYAPITEILVSTKVMVKSGVHPRINLFPKNTMNFFTNSSSCTYPALLILLQLIYLFTHRPSAYLPAHNRNKLKAISYLNVPLRGTRKGVFYKFPDLIHRQRLHLFLLIPRVGDILVLELDLVVEERDDKVACGAGGGAAFTGFGVGAYGVVRVEDAFSVLDAYENAVGVFGEEAVAVQDCHEELRGGRGSHFFVVVEFVVLSRPRSTPLPQLVFPSSLLPRPLWVGEGLCEYAPQQPSSSTPPHPTHQHQTPP